MEGYGNFAQLNMKHMEKSERSLSEYHSTASLLTGTVLPRS
jgi:hypothetical protein